MKRYVLLLVLLMVVGFIIQKMIITSYYPESNFTLMHTIPLFFILLGGGSILTLHLKPNPSLIVILGIKTIKILFSLAFILLYIVLNGENKTVFLVSFLCYFFIYLGVETWMLSTMNKKTKN